MPKATFWLYVNLGRALIASDILTNEGRAVTAEELDQRYPEEGYDAVGRGWCADNRGQLHLLANAATEAEQISHNQLAFGLDYIRRKAPDILAPLQHDAGGAYLLALIAGPTGEGNREQLRTHLLGSLNRIATGE